MGRKNSDSKFARKYSLPLEVLQEGLPPSLWGARDNQVRGGNLVRVSSAFGLRAARATPGEDPIKVYVVSYLPPSDAVEILGMLPEKPHVEAGGAAGAAAGGAAGPAAGGAAGGAAGEAAGPPAGEAAEPAMGGGAGPGNNLRHFVILNDDVLHAKAQAEKEIQDEISKIEQLMENVRQNQPPYQLPSLPPHDKDPGLIAGLRLQPLKMEYFVSCAVEGHVKKAKQVLKQINKPLHDSLFAAGLTEEEVLESVLELANDYQNKALNSSMLSKQILSLISIVDLEDKKRLLLPDATNQDDKKKLLQSLKRVKRKLRKLGQVQTLIGADF